MYDYSIVFSQLLAQYSQVHKFFHGLGTLTG